MLVDLVCNKQGDESTCLKCKKRRNSIEYKNLRTIHDMTLELITKFLINVSSPGKKEDICDYLETVDKYKLDEKTKFGIMYAVFLTINMLTEIIVDAIPDIIPDILDMVKNIDHGGVKLAG